MGIGGVVSYCHQWINSQRYSLSLYFPNCLILLPGWNGWEGDDAKRLKLPEALSASVTNLQDVLFGDSV